MYQVYVLAHLLFTKTLQGVCYYHPKFTKKEISVKKSNIVHSYSARKHTDTGICLSSFVLLFRFCFYF